MFKVYTSKKTGKTAIVHVKSGRIIVFDNLHVALQYIGIMRDLYYVPYGRKAPGEPYPVLSLNPGRYPIRVKAEVYVQ